MLQDTIASLITSSRHYSTQPSTSNITTAPINKRTPRWQRYVIYHVDIIDYADGRTYAVSIDDVAQARAYCNVIIDAGKRRYAPDIEGNVPARGEPLNRDGRRV